MCDYYNNNTKLPTDPKKFSPDRRVKQVLDSLDCLYTRVKVDEDLVRYDFDYSNNRFCCNLTDSAQWVVLKYFFDASKEEFDILKQVCYDYGWVHNLRTFCEMEHKNGVTNIPIHIVAEMHQVDDDGEFKSYLVRLMRKCLLCQQQIEITFRERMELKREQCQAKAMQQPKQKNLAELQQKMLEMIELSVEALGGRLENGSKQNEILYQFEHEGGLFDVEMMGEDCCRITLYTLLAIPYEDLTLARSLCGGVEAGFKMVKSCLVGNCDEDYPIGCYSYFDMPMIYNVDAFVEFFSDRVRDCSDIIDSLLDAYKEVKSEQEIDDIDISEICQLINKRNT